MNPTKHLLMCEPTGYTVNYEINPYMKSSVIDPALALRQWRSVKDALIDGGAEVTVVPGDARYPDMVFAANAAQIIRGSCFKTAILAKFKSEHRAGETELWASRMPATIVDALMSFNSENSYGPASNFFEGQGDIVTMKARYDPTIGQLYRYVVGFGQRTSISGARLLSGMIREFSTTAEVTRVKLRSPYFYHLDTCVFSGSKACLVIKDAIDPDYYEGLIGALRAENPHKLLIGVTEDEGKTLCCNMVQTSDDTVVSGLLPARVKQRLEDAGYKCIEVDTSEFLKAGGSVRCMTLDL